MSNNIAKTNGGGNGDGFGGARRTKRPRQYLKWDDANGWRDRDDLRPPEVLVLMSVCEFLQRWSKDGDRNVSTVIEDLPLPDLETLNDSIPAAEWPVGRDGKKEPPFKYNVGFTLVDPATGMSFFYSNSTWGARALYDDMNEAVMTMRALRGVKCVPVVRLGKRPRKSKRYGSVIGPDMSIVGWKTLGGGGGDNALPVQPAPQLAGPAEEQTPLPEPEAPPQPRPAKRPITVSEYTLAMMGEPNPVKTEEYMNDALEDLYRGHE
jgi:hypothetical protein